MKNEQTECRRCGTCCSKGGPALHLEDAELIRNGSLPIKRLITIRKGELVIKPHKDEPQTAACELIKISGTGSDWQCFFYDEEQKGCMIYESRPLSCRLLQCWDTEAVEDLVEKNTLSRLDLVGEKEPIRKMIETHEKQCPCPDLDALRRAIAAGETLDLEALQAMVNDDIRIRTEAVQKLKISLAEELFYFGRPIFQLLQQIGVKIKEEEGLLKLRL